MSQLSRFMVADAVGCKSARPYGHGTSRCPPPSPSTEQLVVVCVRADPESQDPFRRLVFKGTISIAYACGPDLSDALEVKRWMRRVGLQQLEVLVGSLSNLGRERVVQRPEAR